MKARLYSLLVLALAVGAALAEVEADVVQELPKAQASATLETIETMLSEKRYAEAIPLMREGLDAGTLKQAEVGRYLCEALMITGDAEAAREAANKALTGATEGKDEEWDPFLFVCASHANAALGDGRSAVALAQALESTMARAAEKDSEEAQRALSLGKQCEFWGHWVSGEWEEALVSADDHRQRWPQSPVTSWLHTAVLVALGRHSDAATLWEPIEVDGVKRQDVTLFVQMLHLMAIVEQPPLPASASGQMAKMLHDQDYFACITPVEAGDAVEPPATLVADYGQPLSVLPLGSCGSRTEPKNEEVEVEVEL